MKTFLPKIEERKWYIIDAKDLVLGKLSVKIADILRGKNKAIFTHHIDTGDNVIVLNCDKFKITGNKMEFKNYYRHSGYAKDGLKKENMERKLAKDPAFVMRHAISGMLPKNKLRKQMILRLKLFTGTEHTHLAQNPQTIKL